MSWMKHRAVPASGGSGRQATNSAIPPMPPVQMFNPNQHSNHQMNSQWQQVDLSTPTNTWYDNQQPAQQQNNWYQPQQQAYQPPVQHFSNQQQSTAPYYQQQTQPLHYQPPQHAYQQQQQQPPMQPFINSAAASTVVDNKSDAWNAWNNWGDEDNSNNMQHVPDEAINANVKQETVENSCATSQSWSWGKDEKNQSVTTLAENDQHANDTFPKVTVKNEFQNLEYGKSDQIMKLVKSEALTPQWSIESQPSQDSSIDDVALLQSDTEQKRIIRTSTTTNSSNPPSSVDLTSNSQISSTTNTNSISSENKEVIGLQQNAQNITSGVFVGRANNTTSIGDLSSEDRGVSFDIQSGSSVRNSERISAQIGEVQEQDDSTLQHPQSRPSYRHNVKNILPTLENIEVPSSTILQSERNQYLETGQLLGDNGADADSSQAPPPAFSRVVVGQRESSDDVRFGGTEERTLPAGSDVGVRTRTYRPRGDTSDDDEDSAFDDNEPLAPSFPTQPILPRSATIGAETLTSISYLPPQMTIPHAAVANFHQEQRDTHLDGANTLDDLNNRPVQQSDLNVQQAGVGGEVLPNLGGGSGTGEVGSGPEGQEEDTLEVLTGGVRQLVVSCGESDNQSDQGRGFCGNDALVVPRRSSKHTNDSSEELPPHQPFSNDHLQSTNSTSKKQQTRQTSSHNKSRDRYTPTNNHDHQHHHHQQQQQQQDRNDRHPFENQRKTAGARGDRRRGGGDYRRRDRSEDSDYDSREASGLLSGEENRRVGESHRRRIRDEDDGKQGNSRHNKGGDRDKDRYRHRDDHAHSYYRSNKRRDEYDDYDNDLAGAASRASSRSESLQEVYRSDRRSDRDRDRDRNPDRDARRHRDGDRRDKHGRGGYAPKDPYGGGGYMQGYYDPYRQSSAHAHPYYYQQYQYYENLRISNPQAYAEWYRKFYQGQQQRVQRGLATTSVNTIGSVIVEDRASLHSGRSSANDELAKERYLRQSYYGGHSGTAMMQHQPNAGVGYYHRLNRDSASISSHYGLDDSRHHDYTDSTAFNDISATSFQPIDTSLTSLSHYGLPPVQAQVSQPRLTLAKFSTSHVIGSISSAITGQLIHVPVQYPLDGEGAVVHLIGLGEVLGEEKEYEEMVRFPGPLVTRVTHKKTVIEYCEEKIRTAREDIAVDCDSYILLWELLILLLRHNGVVVGADISDLLMRHTSNRQPQSDHTIRPSSVNSNTSSNACVDQNSNSEASNVNNTNENRLSNAIGMKEDAITNKFRQYLIYGSVKEALEWAMKNGLWGHALFLASKLDKRTYSNVMKRFANGLPINDPLQTLYQLLSGSIPAAVTCIADERWGDWRPHLAMILANATSNPELDRRSILSLGDTLDARGSIYAAQFCYIMAQVEFTGGKLNGANSSSAGEHRLVLLGEDRKELLTNVRRYARTEAIHMTEVYEYACGLNGDGFFIPAFQIYKYLLATRLCDHGLVERALAYLERIATIVLANQSVELSNDTSTLTGTSGNATTIFDLMLVSKVCQLADRLRYCDPSGELEQGEEEGEGSNGWLERLMKLDKDYRMGLISHSTMQNQEIEIDNSQQHVGNAEELAYDQKIWQHPQGQQQLNQEQQQQQMASSQQQWQQHEQNQQQQHHIDPNYQQQQHFSLDQTLTNSKNGYNQQQDVWPNRSQQLSYNSPVLTDHLQSADSLQWNHTQTEPTTPVVKSKGDSSRTSSPKRSSDDVPQARQLISMPNQSSKKPSDDLDDDIISGPTSSLSITAKTKSGQPTTKPVSKNEYKGWLDGIFGRLSMRPKNQMKLPDDKNPTIVWDPLKKRWINTEEDGADASSELRPPPKMADLLPQQIMQQPISLPTINMANIANSTPPSMMAKDASNVAGQSDTQTPTVDVVNTVTGKPPTQGGNMFKMQRSRNLKKSYVDVFNPGGISTSVGSAPALLADNNAGYAASSADSGPVPHFFIPQSVAGANASMDFLTPTTGMPSLDHQQQQYSRSRCSSPASSLSREVSHFMATAQSSQHRLTPSLRPPGSYHTRR